MPGNVLSPDGRDCPNAPPVPLLQATNIATMNLFTIVFDIPAHPSCRNQCGTMGDRSVRRGGDPTRYDRSRPFW